MQRGWQVKRPGSAGVGGSGRAPPERDSGVRTEGGERGGMRPLDREWGGERGGRGEGSPPADME